jgi:RNA polymerase sigma-70 factor (ECF subfamily)
MTSKEIEETFIEAYRSYNDSIFRLVLFKLNNREKALDLTQEVFMKTWSYVSKNSKMENLKAFLYKVANNLIVDEYRKRNHTYYNSQSLEALSEDGFEPKEETDTLERMIDKMDGEKVLQMVKLLPDIYSDVLFMKYVEEYSVTEIAEITQESVNVISVRLNRALGKLRELVKEKEQNNENI